MTKASRFIFFFLFLSFSFSYAQNLKDDKSYYNKQKERINVEDSLVKMKELAKQLLTTNADYKSQITALQAELNNKNTELQQAGGNKKKEKDPVRKDIDSLRRLQTLLISSIKAENTALEKLKSDYELNQKENGNKATLMSRKSELIKETESLRKADNEIAKEERNNREDAERYKDLYEKNDRLSKMALRDYEKDVNKAILDPSFVTKKIDKPDFILEENSTYLKIKSRLDKYNKVDKMKSLCKQLCQQPYDPVAIKIFSDTMKTFVNFDGFSLEQKNYLNLVTMYPNSYCKFINSAYNMIERANASLRKKDLGEAKKILKEDTFLAYIVIQNDLNNLIQNLKLGQDLLKLTNLTKCN